MRWLACICPKFRNPSDGATECYVLAWLMGEVGIAMVLSVVPIMNPPITVRWSLCIVVSLRIIEIIQRVVVTKVKDVFRTSVLAAINFVELALCFGIVYASNFGSLEGTGPQNQPIDGFYFSIITQLTVGYGDVYPSGWLRLVAALQGLLGAFFVIVVFARIIPVLPTIGPGSSSK
jgi:hypothetical protein